MNGAGMLWQKYYQNGCWSLHFISNCSHTVFCLIHVIWTTILGYLEPAPMRCLPNVLIMQSFLLIRFWFSFPKNKSMDLEFQKRRRAHFYHLLWRCFMSYQMLALSKVFKIVPLDFQWIAGFVLQLVTTIVLPQNSKNFSKELVHL